MTDAGKRVENGFVLAFGLFVLAMIAFGIILTGAEYHGAEDTSEISTTTAFATGLVIWTVVILGSLAILYIMGYLVTDFPRHISEVFDRE